MTDYSDNRAVLHDQCFCPVWIHPTVLWSWSALLLMSLRCHQRHHLLHRWLNRLSVISFYVTTVELILIHSQPLRYFNLSPLLSTPLTRDSLQTHEAQCMTSKAQEAYANSNVIEAETKDLDQVIRPSAYLIRCVCFNLLHFYLIGQISMVPQLDGSE